MSNSNNNQADFALTEDREQKSVLVLEAVAAHAQPDSKFPVLQAMHTALQAGDRLQSSIISEGRTNYSYKVFLQNNSDLALYAKLAFPFALWNPDRNFHYDVKRTENEFHVIQQFAKVMGEDAPVAQPYFICDVADGAKVYATEWAAKCNEMVAFQFRDGTVDPRVLKKVALALATLNQQTVDDPRFNENVKPALLSLTDPLKKLFAEELESTTPDASTELFRQYGLEYFSKILERQDAELQDNTECLIHNDAHTFNVLVEPRPDTTNHPEVFAQDGDVVICDWEMAMPGPLGRDLGKFQGWPIGCAMVLAVQGKVAQAYNVLESTLQAWDTYAKVLREDGGKDDETMLRALRQCMGGAGFVLFVCCFLLRLLNDQFPLDDVSEEDWKRARSAFGIVGFELLRLSYMDAEPGLDEEGLRSYFKSLVSTQIDSLAPTPKRASVTTNKRLGFGKPSARQSITQEAGGHTSFRRMSTIERMSERLSFSAVRLSLVNGNFEEDL